MLCVGCYDMLILFSFSLKCLFVRVVIVESFVFVVDLLLVDCLWGCFLYFVWVYVVVSCFA